MSPFTQTDYFSCPSPPTRSVSSSSASSTSSIYSRSSEDVFDRLVTQTAYTAIHLWSAGNLRLDGHDLTLAAGEILKLMETMGQDARFKLIDCVMFDAEGEDWKMTYNRTTVASPSSSSAGSDCGSDA